MIVIGGGFAGLAAATALAERGVRVTVVEERRQLGGRATAHRDPATGERIDNGQHVLAGCYDETLRFLERIGTSHLLRRPSGLSVAMIDEAGTRHDLRLPPLPSPLHLVAGVLAWRQLSWVERAAILRIGPVLQRLARSGRHDHVQGTVREWLIGQRQPARLRDLFWEPLALATLNQPIETASAGPFLAVIARMLGGDADAATILLPAALLDALYAEPARAYLLARGSTVVTGQSARIAADDAAVRGVVAGDTLIACPRVIATVPWFAFGDLFPEVPAPLEQTIAHARTMASSPIVTVNLWLDRDVLTDDFLGLPGRSFQWVFDKRRIVGGELSHVSLVSSGADEIVALDNAQLAERATRELEDALPSMRGAQVRRRQVVRERRATFSLAPGQPPRPRNETAIPGLLLAGDWIDTGLPATIESAVVSGHRAALLAADRPRP